jgi:hypothetical protein
VEVPGAAWEEISKKINDPNYDGYYLRHQTFIFGQPLKSSYWTFKIMKLFRNKSGVFKCDCAHGAIQGVRKPGEIRNPLYHYAHPDIKTFIRKINLYSSQDAQCIFREKRGGLFNKKITRINFRNLIIEPFLFFLFIYFYHKSFKDRLKGFIVSVLMMFYLFLERLKVWELSNRES